MSYVFLKLAKPVAMAGVVAYGAYGVKQWRDAEKALGLKGASDTKLSEIFDEIDADRSGFIDQNELKNALEKRGVHFSERGIQAMIDKADDNHDGKMSKDEFLHLIHEIEKGEDVKADYTHMTKAGNQPTAGPPKPEIYAKTHIPGQK